MPEINIGAIGHIAHGKTTLIKQLTGKKTQEHSEEVKRGLTIRLGYANFTLNQCNKCDKYTVKDICPYCKGKSKVIRGISFVDSPGHETLMATMLSGAATMDGAILVIAANEECPQPQTKEHLIALEISGVKNIIIVQNKIDLVNDDEAKENYEQIKNFVKGTVAENSPIIPISAQFKANLDILLETIEKTMPTPKRNIDEEPYFLVLRSFDVNKPGEKIKDLKGGVVGGILNRGRLKKGDKIEILPGRREEIENKVIWKPYFSEITEVNVGGIKRDEILPGGSGGICTKLDPAITKSDSIVGQVIGKKGKMPPVWEKLKLEVNLLDRVVGSREEIKIEPLKTNELVMINAWTARSVGIITSSHDNEIEISLKLPICIPKGKRIVLSRKVGHKWRLVGYGIIK